MTNREKAIIMAHTQIATLVGDDLGIYYKYVEEILGRPVMTHDLSTCVNEIVEKSKSDFIKICQQQETDLERFKSLFNSVGIKYNEQECYFDQTLTELDIIEPLDEGYNNGLKIVFAKDGKIKEFIPSGE